MVTGPGSAPGARPGLRTAAGQPREADRSLVGRERQSALINICESTGVAIHLVRDCVSPETSRVTDKSLSRVTDTPPSRASLAPTRPAFAMRPTNTPVTRRLLQIRCGQVRLTGAEFLAI